MPAYTWTDIHPIPWTASWARSQVRSWGYESERIIMLRASDCWGQNRKEQVDHSGLCQYARYRGVCKGAGFCDIDRITQIGTEAGDVEKQQDSVSLQPTTMKTAFLR